MKSNQKSYETINPTNHKKITSLEKYPQKDNTYTLGRTNSYLIVLKACSVVGIHIWYCKLMQLIVTIGIMGPRGQLATATILSWGIF